MYIHEAIKKTRSASDSIFRKSWPWLNGEIIEKSVFIRARGRMVFAEHDAPHPFFCEWIPSAEDLLADDWEVHQTIDFKLE